MFAHSTRQGGIYGWSPTNDHHDSHYSTIPTPTSALSSSSSSHNLISRSLSLDSEVRQRADDEAEADEWSKGFSPYHNATSLRRYRLKRSRDPTWAPRPPNAFILFRRMYAKEHQGEELSSTEKTTLSKRAGDAWRALTVEEQKAWFDRAKEEAADHLRRNPNYTFKPNKQSRSESRKHPALVSRREQVEAFIRKASTRRRNASSARSVTDECPTPGSIGSSASPEPPDTPSSQGYAPQMDFEGQSCAVSIPPPVQVTCPVPLPSGGDDPLMSNTSVGLTPPLVSDQPEYVLKRTCSYTDGGYAYYSPFEYFSYDDFYTESDGRSVRAFDSVPYFGGDTSSEQWSSSSSPNGFNAPLQMPEPITMPSTEILGSSQMPPSTSYIPPSSSPLMERRRRAATTSMIPSPLTVVTSSLSGWARDDLVTSRLIPIVDPVRTSTSHHSLPAAPVLSQTLDAGQTDTTPQIDVTEEAWNQPMTTMQSTPEAMNMLTVPIPEVDLDRTPRGTVFPQNTENTLSNASESFVKPELEFSNQLQPSPDPLAAPAFNPFDMTADLESYNIGLRQYGICPPHDMYPTRLDDLVDFSELYLANPVEHH